MSDPARLRLDYRSALVGFLSVRSEAQLTSAYELGRTAILGQTGLLDLVQLHNSVTLDLVRAAASAEERLEIADAAAAFLVEVLASSEMARRGFLESARGPGEDPD